MMYLDLAELPRPFRRHALLVGPPPGPRLVQAQRLPRARTPSLWIKPCAIWSEAAPAPARAAPSGC